MRTCAHKYAHACANVHYKKMHYHKQQPLGAHLLNVCCTSHVPGCAFTRQACLCLGCIAWKQLRVFFSPSVCAATSALGVVCNACVHFAQHILQMVPLCISCNRSESVYHSLYIALFSVLFFFLCVIPSVSQCTAEVAVDVHFGFACLALALFAKVPKVRVVVASFVCGAKHFTCV